MMDVILELWVAALIERSKLAWMLGGGSPWQPGERLDACCLQVTTARATPDSDVRVTKKCCGKSSACLGAKM